MIQFLSKIVMRLLMQQAFGIGIGNIGRTTNAEQGKAETEQGYFEGYGEWDLHASTVVYYAIEEKCNSLLHRIILETLTFRDVGSLGGVVY